MAKTEDERRVVRVQVILTKPEAEMVDKSKGSFTRSSWLREQILKSMKASQQ